MSKFRPIKPTATSPPRRSTVSFSMRKSGLYRTIHADGGWGGITPAGMIHLDLYSEYTSSPTKYEYTIAPSGLLEEGSLNVLESGTVMVRDLEVGVMMTAEAATSIANWLLRKVDEAKNQKAQPAESIAETTDKEER